MERKKKISDANVLFLILILLAVLVNIFASFLELKKVKINIIANVILSQGTIIIPGLIYYIRKSKEEKIVKFNRIGGLSGFLLLVFTWLMMPLVTCANAFSQLFTKNEVINVSGDILTLPLWAAILIVGILGPFCEEFVFRGLLYNSLKLGSGRFLASGLVSALFFGLMHMNFNQFCYAFVLGLVFAIINESLDSIWPSFICHAIVNSQNVLMLYLMDTILKASGDTDVLGAYNNSMNMMQNGSMKVVFLIMMVGLLLVSVVTTGLAGLLFYGICALEGKTDRFKNIFEKTDKNNRQNLLNIYGVIAITICLFIIFLLNPLLNLIK